MLRLRRNHQQKAVKHIAAPSKAVKYVATPSQPSPAPPSWSGYPKSGKDEERLNWKK